MNTQIFLNGITVEQLAEALLTLFLKVQNESELTQPENDLITRKELSTLLSINYTTIWKHSKSGKFERLGIGNRVFYSRKQVLEAVKPLQV
jgi:predicted DNA-binding transcriptional regulator AlpA